MPSSKNFQFLAHGNINKQQWDLCVANAANSLVYGYSFYLDSMCPNWSAVVGENYEWVWPITGQQKYGVAYLYQPHFTQQLGPFYLPHRSQFNWAPVVALLLKKWKFWEVNLNYAMHSHFFPTPVVVTSGTNLVLNLAPDFNKLKEQFTGDLKRNLKLSMRCGLQYKSSSQYQHALQMYISLYASRMPQVKPHHFERLNNLVEVAAKNNMVVCRQVTNAQNQLMAIALFLNDGKRLYNLLNSTTLAGKKCSANHYLMHQLIVEFAGSGLLLDFEGSDLPGVKAFYKNFGGENEPYLKLKYNALPWPLRLFKQ